MTGADAISRLQALPAPALTTADAAVLLGMSVPAANRMLGRLEKAGLVMRIKHGLWAIDKKLDALGVAPYLTAPYDAYVSLQSALYLRGASSQIPTVTYVVSLARPRVLKTALGTFSIHRVTPVVFGGFEVLDSGVRLATREKALFDLFYLSAVGGNDLFAALPEIDGKLKRRAVREWIARIGAPRVRTLVERRFAELSGSA
jgi:predicted transcriptional regulator of viral defense system